MSSHKKIKSGVWTTEPFKDQVYLSSPTMHGTELAYVQKAYDSGWMSTVGENIDSIERLAEAYTGVRHAVALSCGTAALHLAVKLAAQRLYHTSTGISTPDGPGYGGSLLGRRVFCSDLTFAATVSPVVYEGAEPVFVDVEPQTWNMDPAALERAFELYPDVKLVVFAHLYGTPGMILEIKAIKSLPEALAACFWLRMNKAPVQPESGAPRAGSRHPGTSMSSWAITIESATLWLVLYGDSGRIWTNISKRKRWFMTDTGKDLRILR